MQNSSKIFFTPTVEFLHNSKFSGNSWQNPASIEEEKQNTKIFPTRD